MLGLALPLWQEEASGVGAALGGPWGVRLCVGGAGPSCRGP